MFTESLKKCFSIKIACDSSVDYQEFIETHLKTIYLQNKYYKYVKYVKYEIYNKLKI